MMLPNPFSEEDAHRYIAEFKSWPHNFPPDQLVYAGFRSAATTPSSDMVKCYGCTLTMNRWHDTSLPLELHLQHRPSCPIASIIQEHKTVIDDEIKNDTLAQLNKQFEFRRQNAMKALTVSKQRASLPLVQESHPLMEAYRLHFYWDYRQNPQTNIWHLSSFASRLWLPTEASTSRDNIGVDDLSEAIMEVLGEEGIMSGWCVLA